MITWQKNRLLKKLSSEQLTELSSHLQSHTFLQDELIIREGEEGESLFMIESGKVEIYKDGVVLAEKGAGEHFGAMALLGENKRSANVRALSDTVVKSLKGESLKKLSDEATKSVFFKVLLNHIEEQQATLQNMNLATIKETKAKLKEAKKRISFSQFFLFTLGIMLLYMFVLGIFLEWKEELHQMIYLAIVLPISVLSIGGLCLMYAKKSAYPLRFFGLSLENWKGHLWESFLWTLPVLVLITATKWVYIHFISEVQGQALMDYNSIFRYGVGWSVVSYTVYAAFCPIQEFMARGVYQSGLKELFSGSHATWYAILLSNLLFSSSHLLFNLYFSIVVFIPGLFWGYLYARQKTLVGVSFSHIIVGLYASFLGFH